MNDTLSLNQDKVLSAGIDWLTAYCENGPAYEACHALEYSLIADSKNRGENIEPTSRLGFQGLKGEHWFIGTRPDGAMITLSSVCAAYAATDVIKFATNVSRIDFQYTVSLGRGPENLALLHFKELDLLNRARKRPRSLEFRTARPAGDMVCLNRRITDRYGRIYDKGAESKAGPPHLEWRYEVELKRDPASAAALGACQALDLSTYSYSQVAHFFESKGLLMRGVHAKQDITCLRPPHAHCQSRSRWLSENIGPCIRSEIGRRGVQIVVDELGIGDYCLQYREGLNG